MCNELESLTVKLLPQTCFFLNRQQYNTLLPRHTNVFLDIIVEIQAFSDLQYSLNLLI